MPDDMFNEAVQALRKGQRMRARDLLTRLIKSDQSNINYWLWMSATVDSEKEQVFCLQNALKLDPNSIAARRGLVVLGALKPEEANLPPAHVLEDTHVAIPELPRGTGLEGFLSRRRNREMLLIVGLGSVALIVLIVAGLAAFAPGLLRPRNVVVVTSTPAPTATLEPTRPPPTVDLSACRLPDEPNPATPLAAYLCLEQTPTPAAWPTDLPGAPREVYTRLKNAFLAGSWGNVIQQAPAAFQDDVVNKDPRAHFYAAEAYRHTGNYPEAIREYNTALNLDKAFAPALWGRGMTQWALAHGTDVAADLGRAIEADARFLPAYLDRAAYFTLSGRPADALADLEAALLIAPDDALVMAGLALARVDSGEAQAALMSAQAAVAADPAQPLGYYARGRAAYALEDYKAADADLSLSYAYVMNQESPQPGVLKATVLYHTGLAKVAIDDDAAALSLFNQGLAANETFVPLLLERAELHLRGADFAAARDDLSAAVELTSRGSEQQIQAYLDLAEAFMGLELPDDAANMYRAVLRIDPAHQAALVGLGYAQIALGRYGDAGLSFTEALEAAGTDAERAAALLGRALAREAAGQTDVAVADLLAVQALTPERSFQATVEARLTAIGPLPTGTPTRGPSPTPSATATRTPRPTRTPAAPTRTPTP